MAISKHTRAAAGRGTKKSTSVRNSGDQPPTAAERRRAQASLRKTGGAYLARPESIFLGPSPAETLKRCSRVIKLLSLPALANTATMAALDLQGARLDIFCGVLDALGHAETVLRQIGSEPDPVGEAAS
jgi:hypothetical protein